MTRRGKGRRMYGNVPRQHYPIVAVPELVEYFKEEREIQINKQGKK